MKVIERIWNRRDRDMSREAYEKKREALGFTDDGLIMDSTPMAPPVGYVKQPSMVDIIREQIRNHTLQAELDRAGFETFEEADDFNVGDADELPRSIYEMEENFDPAVSRAARAEPVSSPPDQTAKAAEAGEVAAPAATDESGKV